MKWSKQKVGLIFFPAFDWAISSNHPEREERLLYTRDQIVEEGILDIPDILEYRPPTASDVDIKRAHICVPGINNVCTTSHRIAAGGCILAADLVMKGEVDRAFALVRPPGHHAMRVVHGSRGFCNLNNEAIMIEHIRSTYRPDLKIAVVDTDAHHADGTQDIYYNDPKVLHISLHQDGRTLYPGTGFIEERGGPAAYGLTVNVPLPPGTGDAGILYVMKNLVLPALEDFKPDLIINAAGQDNHFTDPLTNINFTAQGYCRLTEMLSPDLVVLEGGYSIEGALPYVNVGIILSLAGLDYSSVREPDYNTESLKQSKEVTEEIYRMTGILQNMWSSKEKADIEAIFGKNDFFERNRSIYYDTDDISEMQKERLRLCPSCSGWRLIHSRAVGARKKPMHIAAVLIPQDACNQCLNLAYDQYEKEKKAGTFDWVYLQDVLSLYKPEE